MVILSKGVTRLMLCVGKIIPHVGKWPIYREWIERSKTGVRKTV